MMFFKKLKKSKIHNILVVSLSNLGDVIAAFPVIDVLKNDFPKSDVSVVVGPRAISLLEGNPHLKHVYIYDKSQSFPKKIYWALELRKKRFNAVIDLRNTALPFILGAKVNTPVDFGFFKHLHLKEKHLKRLKTVYAYPEGVHRERYAFFVPEEIQKRMDEKIGFVSGGEKRIIVIVPGAADHRKRWPEEGFAKLCDELVRLYHVRVVIVGGAKEHELAGRIEALMNEKVENMTGQSSLLELGAILKRASLVVANDTGIMHLVSYLNTPVVALFGPTNPHTAGPWSSEACFIKKNIKCRACEQRDEDMDHVCMEAITPEDVLKCISLGADGFILKRTVLS